MIAAMAKLKPLCEEDQKLWAAYGRTLSRLLPGRAIFAPEPMPPPAAALPPPPPAPFPPAPGAKRPLTLDAAPAGLDKATGKKFLTGRIPVEARLDLHGHTATRAHHAVGRFLLQAHGAKLRCVEIITGNGAVLARELPHWLNGADMRPLILAIAHPHAANTGAVRILLRRQR